MVHGPAVLFSLYRAALPSPFKKVAFPFEKNPSCPGGTSEAVEGAVLMPGGIDQKGSPDPSALESYQKGGLTLAELQRGAKNVLRYILHSNALNRAEA